MNILFINANLYGHINPTLGLVRKFAERGNRINYFCEEAFSEQVTEVGANWIGYSNKLKLFLKNYSPSDRHPFFMLMEYMLSYDEMLLPEILDIIGAERYDMIICDSYFGGACFLKQILNIPVVCSHSSFAMSHVPVPERMLAAGFHPQLDHCYQILNRICEKYKIAEPSLEQVFTSRGDLNIVYTIHSFNGDDGLDEKNYLFTGPSIDRPQEAEPVDFSIAGDRKVIYISLGSINTDYIDFYKTCILAFRDTNYFVYMSIGKKCEATQLGEIPSNFLVKSFLPQLEILKQADVFISHAGFNSVNEAIYFGVPILALPQVNDQKMVAGRLAHMQLGVVENIEELTGQILKSKTEALMMDINIKDRCIQLATEMKNAAKLWQTVERLEKYAEEWEERGKDGIEK